MAVSVIVIICARFSDASMVTDGRKSPGRNQFAVLAQVLIALIFIIQLSLMGSTQVSRRGPSEKRFAFHLFSLDCVTFGTDNFTYSDRIWLFKVL